MTSSQNFFVRNLRQIYPTEKKKNILLYIILYIHIYKHIHKNKHS